MPDPKPLLTKPRVMLATLRNRQGGFRVSWTGALRGGRWSSLLAMAAKRSPLSSMAPRKSDQDPGRLTHTGRVTTVRDESASVEAQTLIPHEPKPTGATMMGFVSMPKRESAPKSPLQPTVPESIPVVVVVPRPTPPEDAPKTPPPPPPRRRLSPKTTPPPLKRQPRQTDLHAPQTRPTTTTTTPLPSPTTPPLSRPVPPPKRFGPKRRPVRALLSMLPASLLALGGSPQPTGSTQVPPRPTGSLAKVLPQPRPELSPLPQPQGPLGSDALPKPPRLPPRVSKPLPPVPTPKLGPTALGLTATQLGADVALGLLRPDGTPLVGRPRRGPHRPPPLAPPRLDAHRQGDPLTTVSDERRAPPPTGQDAPKLVAPQGSSPSPSDLIPTLPKSSPIGPTFASRLRASSLPLGLMPILSRGSSPTQVRFTPELTTVLQSVEPLTQSPSLTTPPPREPTLLERSRGVVPSQQPPPSTIKTSSEQLKEAHELSDRLDKVVKSLPKTVVGKDPTTPSQVDLTPGRVTGAEGLQQARDLSDRLDKVTESIHGPRPLKMGLKRMPRGGLLTPSPLVLGSINPPTPMRNDDSLVVVPDQVQGSPSSAPQSKGKPGSLPRIPIPRTTSGQTSVSKTPRVSSLERHREEASTLAKSATATWWPTWTEVPTRPPSTTALTERFARALQIVELRGQVAPSHTEKMELAQLEADEGADLYRFGSHILLDKLLTRPFLGELPKPPEPTRGGLRGRANAMLARGPSMTSIHAPSQNGMAIWQRGVLRNRTPRPESSPGKPMGTPRVKRDTGTSHTTIPDVPASMLDSIGTLDGNVGESSGSSSRADRFERSPRGRSENQKTVIDAWRKRDIRETDFDDDRTLARMALEDLMFEEKVLGKRPETRDRDLQKRLERLVGGGGNSHREAEYLAEEIESNNLRPEERVRWHRASVLAAKSRDSWWPTWIDRVEKNGRAEPLPEPPTLRSMAARYARALEFVELRDLGKRTPEQKRRMRDLQHEEVAQRDAVGSWLHLDLLLKRPSRQTASPGRKSGPKGVVIPQDASTPVTIHDDVEQIVISTRKRSTGDAPPPPSSTTVPPVPTTPPVPLEKGGLEPDAQSKATLGSESSDAPPKATTPQPTVDQLLSAMDDTTLARLVQRVLDDRSAGGAVLARAIDLLERRARFGALREVR